VRLLTDLTPLRESPAFRRLWLGNMLSRTGSAMSLYAVMLQVFTLTRSTAAVGGLGLAGFLPLLLIALPGGTLADQVDRRRLVLLMAAGQAAVAAALFALTVSGRPSVWALYALVAAAAGLSAVGDPARQALIPGLVPRPLLPAAMAVNRAALQAGLIAGPALAGVIAAGTGLGGCYLADLVSFAAALWSVAQRPARSKSAEPQLAQPRPARSGLAQTWAGLAFIGRTPVLCGAFLADVNATFFALPVSLFPAINAERFHGDPRTLGLFSTMIGVGGLAGAVFGGPLHRVIRYGLVMLGTVAVWGAAFAVFAVASSLWLTLLALGLAGLADTCTVVIRGTIVQTVTPQEYRGRVNAADFLVGAGGGQLGSLESGLVGSFTSPVISALSGGLLTVAGTVLIGLALPGFRRYRAESQAESQADCKAGASNP
jgi:MFS family permease